MITDTSVDESTVIQTTIQGASRASEPGATSRRKKRRPPAPVSLPASVAVAATTIATAVSFCRIFPGWDFLAPLLITVITVHAVMTIARIAGWPVLIAVPAGVVALGVVVGMIHFRSTLFGVIPTRDTWDAVWQSLADAFSQFRTTVSPVPSTGGFAVATALALGGVAILADTFAFRAFGRIEAIVPGGLMFALASSLGVDRRRLLVSAVWLATVILAVAVLRAVHGDHGATWLGNRSSRRLGPTVRAAAALCVVAVGAGLILGPKVPGADEEAIIDTRTSGGNGTEVPSPLVDVQARLVKRSNTELFTVRLDGSPGYLRVASLGDFDGKAFSSESDYEDAVAFVPEPVGGSASLVRQSIRISALGSIFLPAIYSVSTISPASGFRFDPETASIVRPEKLYAGMSYEIESVVSSLSPDELRATGSSAPPPGFTDIPGDFPAELIDEARRIVAGAPTVFDQMIALQTFFRQEFTYNDTVSRGHSIRSIEAFLRAREGYCEQFSTTFAAFARVVGVASRVAVGFTPGDVDADGVWHVLGKHAHAWPEIWFDGIGWVAFEPTPGRGAPGADTYTGVQPAQDGGVLQGTPDVGPAPEPERDDPSSTLSPTTTRPDPTRPTLPRGEFERRDEAGGVSPAAGRSPTDDGPSTPLIMFIGALVAVALWAALMPPVARALRRRRKLDPAEQVTARWAEAARWLGHAGAPRRPEETPIEFAERAWRQAGVTREPVRDLARAATDALFRAVPPDVAEVERAGELSDRIARIVRSQLGWRRRLLVRLDPRAA